MFKRILAAILCTCTLAIALASCNFSGSHNESAPDITQNKEDNEISCEEALDIAKEYWKIYDIEENGYLVIEADNKDAPETVYVFALKRLVEIEDISHYSTVDEVWVDRATGEATPPYDAKPGLMFDYDEVLWCYKYAVDYYNYGDHDTVDDVIDRFNIHYGKGFLNETEKEWFADIATSGYILYPGKNGDHRFENNNACGYAKKDLNGDGTAELVLLNSDYTVVALFSMHENRPILLQSFSDRAKGLIDKNGYIHICVSNGADTKSLTIRKISDDGGSLEPLFEYGLDGHEFVDGVAVTKYYKTEKGTKKYITEEEYNTIDGQYKEYLENKSGVEVTKSSSGLQFKPLFASMLTFSSYENILDSLRFMTSMYNYYKIGEAEREDFEYRYDLSTEENREMYEKLDDLVSTWYPPALGASFPAEDAFAYAIKDLNGDGVDELILIEGERYRSFAVMTEIGGKIVFDNSYSWETPSGETAQKLAYWINTVGLDLKPLFAESEAFDLGAIRRKAIYEFDRSLTGMPFSDVWVPMDEEHISLMDYVAMTPSGKKPLSEIEDIKFAFIDMNSDTVDELIIDCGEILILHFSYASVHLQPLSIDQAYKLNTNGSFMWKSMEEKQEYGERRITSWNGNGYYSTEELWKIVNDGEPNAEYYIGGEQVTEVELQKYFAENHRTPVEFFPLDELWGDMLSPLEAIEVGREYWKECFAEEDLDVVLGFRSKYYNEKLGDAPESVYIVQLVKYDSRHNPTCVGEIWVDKATGETNPPYGMK